MGTGEALRPGASVIIVAYNGRHYLDGCLHSVLDELRPGDEVIVVDNASTDGSADFVSEHYPQARLVRNAENRGFAAANNQGAALASGEVLVFLNQDTRVQAGWLQALVEGLGGGDAVGLTTSKVLVMSQPDRIQACGQDVHYTGLVFGRGFGAAAGSLDGAEAVGAVGGCSFAARLEVWQQLGGFDETLYMYYEETDLSWRARLRGYRSVYVPDSVVYHDYRPGRPSAFRLYHSARNRRIMLLKNWRWPTLFLLAPGLLVAELVEWELAQGQGWGGLKAKLRADFWLASHLGLIRRLHTDAQKGRSVSDAEILAERTVVLQPQEVAVGTFGQVSMAIGSALFALNHRIAQTLCRLGGL
ncbi:MAG TPA: glycosyltransferase family 2 protein [Anaerolineae bacterium]|nr:glycosyltransferase family 2 protein [Anaerolineae bacterium]